MSLLVDAVALAGLTAVVCVAICATTFGAGLPLVLVLGVWGRHQEREAMTERAMPLRDGRRDGKAA